MSSYVLRHAVGSKIDEQGNENVVEIADGRNWDFKFSNPGLEELDDDVVFTLIVRALKLCKYKRYGTGGFVARHPDGMIRIEGNNWRVKFSTDEFEAKCASLSKSDEKAFQEFCDLCKETKVYG